MNFTIKTNNKLDFFAKMINVLSLVDPINKLRPKERELLAYFLYYNDKYKSLDIEERAAMVFHKTTRIDIQELMDIDAQTFYNLKSQLKIKGLLNSEYLSKVFINLYHNTNFNINFIFKDGTVKT